MTNDTRTRAPRRTASVDIVANPRAGRASVTEQEAFIARNEGDITTVERDEATGVMITHNRPGTVTMYKPTVGHGYVPRTVSASAIRLLIRQGWSEHCHDCGKDHLDRNGQHSTDPNLCTARDPVAVRICPVCRKRIFDNDILPPSLLEDDDDPNVIKEEAALTTPAGRTRTLLDLHLWVRHPQRAQMLGIKPLPTALQELAEQRPV